ncbi:hypothetical protein HanRHA438_Chr03g0119791 [Helianthus annuus]|nr:hypothetical protein HanRHA438_Chr03g0119791 [Helianthus annuus]
MEVVQFLFRVSVQVKSSVYSVQFWFGFRFVSVHTVRFGSGCSSSSRLFVHCFD